MTSGEFYVQPARLSQGAEIENHTD